MLALVLRQSLSIAGGTTDTVFPAVEAWLSEDSDRYHAFSRLKGRKSDARYRSVTDFLLCEVVPAWRGACLAFYRDAGPPLRDLTTPAEARALEARLLLFLAVAYESFCQRRRLSWSTAVAIVDDIIARAA